MQVRRIAVIAAVVALLPVFAASGATAASASVPTGFTDVSVAAVPEPTALAFTPDGRMLVASQSGQLWVVHGTTRNAQPALDLTARICSNSERGLLGVAVAADFAQKHWVYLYWTINKHNTCATNSTSAPVNRVSAFWLTDKDTIAPKTERVVADNIASPGGNHNGGDLAF